MTSPSVHEIERIAALHRYRMLDTGRDKAFDDLTALAALLCDAPWAFVSLVDANRVWFKSAHGIAAEAIARTDTFCTHLVTMGGDKLEVPDARADDRFAQSALVVGEPHVRFYSGVPLRAEGGHAIGTLCVLDRVPRALSAAQARAVQQLAQQVMAQMELHRARLEQREADQFFTHSLDLMCIAGSDGYFKRINPTFGRLLGFSDDELMAAPFLSFLHPDDVPATLAEVARLGQGATTIDFVNRYRTKTGDYKMLSWRALPDPQTGLLYAIARDITQQAADQATMVRQLTLNAAVQQSAQVGVISTDADGTIKSFNAFAEQLLGYSATEVVDLQSPAIFHDLDEVVARAAALTAELGRPIAPGFEVFVAKPRESGVADINRWTYLTKAGARIPVDLAVTALRAPGGDVLGYLGTVHDARDSIALDTARRLAEQLIDALPTALVLCDHEGTIVRANAGVADMLGYQADQLLGRNINLLVPPAVRPHHGGHVANYFAAPVRRSMGTGRDLYAQHRDGSLIDVEIALAPVDLANGKGALALVSDVRERKRIEARRIAEQQAINATQAVAEFAMDGTIISANRRFLALLRYGLNEVVGCHHRIFVAAEYGHSAAYREFWQALARGEFQAGEFEHYDKAGNPVWLQATYTPVMGANGRPERVIKFASDISERRRMQDELGAALRAAEQATQTKSLFLANMSHEIRTPMNAIIGLSHLALRTDLTHQQRDYLGKISQSARNLLTIINDILDFSKIEADKLELESAEFDLEHVTSNLATVVSLRAENKGLELVFDIAPDLPRYLLGDATRIGQVLMNLTTNAIKFTDQGEVVVKLAVAARDGDDIRITCAVRDTGMGMTPEQVGRLFQSFSQADASINRTHGGTGLGLTISKKLVHLMGGDISVASEKGAGSTFTATLCLKIAPPRTRRGSGVHTPVVAGLRALVVDDNATARQVFTEMMQAWNLVVQQAASGLEALAEIARAAERGQPFDLIVLDWKMPGMDGLEVAQRLEADARAGGHRPKVVMATAHMDAMFAEHAKSVGVQRVLAKPVNPSVLFDALIDTVHCVDASTAGGAVDEASYAAALTGAHILLAEDNEINQQIASELLTNVGCKVVIANNGAEAVARATPDLDAILMDLQMPVMDGFSATARLLQRPEIAHVPIIAMTANAMVEDRARVTAAGMKGFVAKPVEPRELYETLCKWVVPKMPPTASLLNRAALAVQEVAVVAPVRLQRTATPVEGISAVVQLELPAAIDGIDLVGALRRMGGNRQLLARLLLRFARTQHDAAERIARELSTGDTQTATREAHTVKGLAANLGAERVRDVAAALESALVNQQPTAALVEQLGAALGEVVDAIGCAMSQGGTGSAQPAATAADLAAELRALLALIAEEDIAAQVQCAKVAGLAGGALRDELQRIGDLLGEYEFELAAKAVADLLAGDL